MSARCLCSRTVPDLCWEIAQLQDTYILQGDYDLKVMRREYYVNQQKRVHFYSKFASNYFFHGQQLHNQSSPWPLMKELDEMEKINAKLSAAVEEVTFEHYKKNEIVKHHSQEVGLKWRVFVVFFCNPEHLRYQVRELTSRVRALQTS